MISIMENIKEVEEKRTPVLYITRGIPGSGKTTIALKMVEESDGMLHRVNRDDIRTRIFGRDVLEDFEERVVSKVQESEVIALLQARLDVITDDTNLPVKNVRNWFHIAKKANAKFEVIEVLVPLEEALANNLKRQQDNGRFVPEEVIKKKFENFTPKGKFQPLPDFANEPLKVGGVVLERYAPDPSLPSAWIFDMDGTLALFEGLRGAYDWDKVGGDLPHVPVVNLLKTVAATGVKIIITSARDSVCRAETVQWLNEQGIEFEALFMRAEGDGRKDAICKHEIFNAHIRNNYNITGVVDDRMQVCRLWFDLGLPLFKVGDPELVF